MTNFISTPVNNQIRVGFIPDIEVKKELPAPKGDDMIIERSYFALCKVEIKGGTLDKHLNGKNHKRKLLKIKENLRFLALLKESCFTAFMSSFMWRSERS